ncbi:GNAT family N-acetyltransferase [Shinella sp. G-2]|uniref:GNAT family N-acetyltransferase n=1 Tax=Shinella sp. G-2 TaxID=3133141 RepID=UPI003D0589F9
MNSALETASSGSKDGIGRPTMPARRVAVLTGNGTLFAGFTFARFRHALAAMDSSVIAIGAIVGGHPAGLALGTCRKGEGAELLSVAVAPAVRRSGIGLALIETWREEATRRGSAVMIARYTDTNTGSAAFEALVRRAAWSEPVEDGLMVTGRAGAMADVVGAWRAIGGRLAQPGLYEYAPVELTDADRARIANYLAQPVAVDMLGPAALSDRTSPAFSTLIRREGVLVGWVLASEMADHSIRYEEAFLDPVYWHSGIAIGAYHHCYARQACLLGRDSIATYYTNSTRPRMVALTRRRFAPIADRIDTILAVRSTGRATTPDSLNRKGKPHEHRRA